jgi:hypothetical protein
MRAPLGTFSRTTRSRILWIAGLASLVGWVFLAFQDGEIRDSGGPGIVSFEVAGTADRAQEIVDEWGEDGRDAARLSLIVDYPFLIAYSLFLAVACTVASERFARRGHAGAARVGVPLAWAQFVAGACDAIENAALLRVLDGHTDVYPALALAAAIPKFTLAGLGLLYAVAGVPFGRSAPAAQGPPPEAR